MQAQKSLSAISANRDLWMAQYRQELAERDRFSGLEASRKEGIKEGARNEKRNTIKRLAGMGLSEIQIAQAVDLTVEELRLLR